jgi:hypothetical protein
MMMSEDKTTTYKPNFGQKFTCKSYMFDKAPKRIELLGDKTKKVESAQHIIEFPGGAVEVSRTSDGNYWAHIIINRAYADNDCNGLYNRFGEIVGGRIDCDEGVCEIPGYEDITQIAILIKPTRVKEDSTQ